MAEAVLCPKCGSNGARYEKGRVDVTLRCFCGYLKVVATKLDEEMTIERLDAVDEIALPQRDSKLYECLAVLVGLGKATTGEITYMVNLRRSKEAQRTSGEVSSDLTVLRYKSLVSVVVERKGVAGGSTWAPSDEAVRAIKGVKT